MTDRHRDFDPAAPTEQLSNPALQRSLGHLETLTVRRLPEVPQRARALGRYSILATLGKGGMGEVLSVLDAELGREVAAKVILGQPDERQLAKFVLEARVTGQLQHPAIVPAYELGQTIDGQLYLTMQQVEGAELGEVIEQTASDDRGLRELLRMLLKICDGVAFAHSNGVLHRDLKPANVMVGKYGEVLVMDWGLAKIIGHSGDESSAGLSPDLDARGDELRTMDGAIVGTPAYMPPEQARGAIEELDARADVYALGAILFQMLTGRPPHDGGSAWDVLDKVLAGPPPLASEVAPERDIPRGLEAAAAKALAFDPGDRYESVLELKEDVERFLAGHALEAASYTWAQRTALWIARNQVLAVAGAVLAAVLVATSIISVSFAMQAQRNARDASSQASLAMSNAAVADEKEALAKRATEQEKAHRLRAQAAEQGEREARQEAERKLRRANSRLALAKAREDDPPGSGPMHVAHCLELADTLEGRALMLKLRRAPGVLRGILLGPERIHSGQPPVLAFSRDGQHLLTASGGRQLTRWHVPTMKRVWMVGFQQYVSGAAFAPNGQILVQLWGGKLPVVLDREGKILPRWPEVPGRDDVRARFDDSGEHVLVISRRSHQARLLDVSTRRPLQRISLAKQRIRDRQAWNGRQLVEGGAPLRAWDTRSGKPLAPYTPAPSTRGPYIHPRFSADGRWLVAVGHDGVLVWPTGKPGQPRLLRSPRVARAELSADGSRVVTTSYKEAAARVWDVTSKRQLAILVGHRLPLTSATFSADGERVLTAAPDGTVRLWHAGDGRPIAVMPHGDRNAKVVARLSPDGRTVASWADRIYRLWHVLPAQPQLSGAGNTLSTDDRGRSPMLQHSRTRKSTEVSLHNLRSGRATPIGTVPYDAHSALISETGQHLALFGRHQGSLHRLPGFDRICELPGCIAINGGGFDRQSRWLAWRPVQATRPRVREVLVWSTTGERVARVPVSVGALWPPMGPDGDLVLRKQGAILIRHLSADAPRVTLADHNSRVREVRFSADGKAVLTITTDRGARLWDGRDGRLLARVPLEDSNARGALGPQGKLVISGRKIWRAATGEVLGKVRSAGITDVGFSPCGRFVAVCANGRLQIASTEDGRTIAELEHKGVSPTRPSWGPQGQLLVLGSRGIMRWDLAELTCPVGEARPLARARTGLTWPGGGQLSGEPPLRVPTSLGPHAPAPDGPLLEAAVTLSELPHPTARSVEGVGRAILAAPDPAMAWLGACRAIKGRRPNLRRLLILEWLSGRAPPTLALAMAMTRHAHALGDRRTRAPALRDLLPALEAARNADASHPLIEPIQRILEAAAR